MPTIYDNVERHLLQALCQALEVADSADCCVGYFNLRGWGALADAVDARLDGSDDHCVRVLVGMYRPPEEEMRLAAGPSALRQAAAVDGPAVARLRRQAAEGFRDQLAFGVPSTEAEHALRRLARQLRARQVRVKLFLRYPLHAKLYLVRRQDAFAPRLAYLGSSNLTLSGLSSQGELNVDVLDQDAALKLQRWFDERWDDSFAYDISEDLAELIETSWAREGLVEPYLVYLKMIYHLSEEAREGQREFRLPREFQGVLLDFQAAAVSLAAHHLHRRGGVLLGDVVGLGKTLMATVVAKIFQEDEGSNALIICPPKLEAMWRDYVRRYHLTAEVLSVGRVVDGLRDRPGYRLVIVDESHNLRNREGKRFQAIEEYVDLFRSRCLLLTATPYNKQFSDISNQLRLFLDEGRDLGLRPERFFQDWTADGYNEADFSARFQTSPRSLRAFEQSRYADDWRDLMRLFLVRRTRRFIMANYARYDAVRQRHYVMLRDRPFYFPLRQPRRVTFALNAGDPTDQYARLYREAVVDVIQNLALPRYGLTGYLRPNADRGASADERQILDNLNRAGRRLLGFSRTNLFKRLESSGSSFLLSLRRHILRNLVALHALESNQPLPIGTQDAALLDAAIADEEAAWADQDALLEGATDDALVTGLGDTWEAYRTWARQVYDTYRTQYRTRFGWLSPRFFSDELAHDLEADALSLLTLVQNAGEWDPRRDAKLDELYRLVSETHRSDKVLVFTQFADTALYLAGQLRRRGVGDLAAATLRTGDPTDLARRFSPRSNEYTPAPGETELRVLIATDVLAEGQNLQDCAVVINYDLPWAIVRLIQRAGRVDRIGQAHNTILVYLFEPAEGVEHIIRLRERLSRRLMQNQEVIGSDESYFGEEAAERLRELYTERAGSLDEDEDEDVDLASVALQVWNSASEDARRRAEQLPPIVYATRAHEAVPYDPPGVLAYLRFPGGVDAMVRVDEAGEVVSQSMTAILRAAACPPDTPALLPRGDHHELTAQAVDSAVADASQAGGQLGSLRSTRRKVYERLRRYRETEHQAGRDTATLDSVLDGIFRAELTRRAQEALGRQIRLGITDPGLAELAAGLYAGEQLVRVVERAPVPEPVVVCSMGLKPATENLADLGSALNVGDTAGGEDA